MKKLTSMLTAVDLAMTLSASAGSDDHMPRAPVIAELYECSLNDGKSLRYDISYRKGVAATVNKLADTSVCSAVFLPGIGLPTGWDYVATVTGIPDDMATMMDTVHTGALTAALGKAGLESPSTCVTDLHRPHRMVQMQN